MSLQYIHVPASAVVVDVVDIVVHPQCFSSEISWLIKSKFYVEPPWEGGIKLYLNGQGNMTKMAAMPIY